MVLSSWVLQPCYFVPPNQSLFLSPLALCHLIIILQVLRCLYFCLSLNWDGRNDLSALLKSDGVRVTQEGWMGWEMDGWRDGSMDG